MDRYLIIGLIELIPAAVFLGLAVLIGGKYMVQQARCTQKATGTVVGYTIAAYGDPRYGEHLPLVRYEVDGKSYKVKGPMYFVVSITRRSLFSPAGPSGRALQGENDDQVLYSFVHHCGLGSCPPPAENSMTERFPKGSSVDVYYDPTNPKLAYVRRYYNGKWLFWLFFALGALFSLLAVVFILCGVIL